MLPYIVAQVVGGVIGAGVLYVIASGEPGFDLARVSPPTATAISRPASTACSPALVTEVVMTAMFLFIILGSTHGRAPAGFAPIAIGLGLTLIHLISIPVTNTSVNPARSTAVGAVRRRRALGQLWLFWVAPILGGRHRRPALQLALA